MNGVLIFADDKVFESGSFENKLYENLASDGVPVLPISDLRTLETTIRSMSTFKALILDWNFKRDSESDEELEGAGYSVITPESILNDIHIYSLIYVYSYAEIDEETKNKLIERFPDKVRFEIKVKDSNKSIDAVAEEESEKITKGIKEFEAANKHMEIPFVWSQAINQSVQKIFAELELATPNWVKELGETAENDGGEPISEIINIFNNILGESLIQNNDLRVHISKNTGLEQVPFGKTDTERENTAKLYRRIFYSKITKDAPSSTGDIFKFDDNKYGILITPECNLSNESDTSLAFLIIDKDASDSFIKKKKGGKGAMENIFNNGVISRHVLVSFPFNDGEFGNAALIDFRTSLHVCKKQDIKGVERYYKLNSPYIHQLRQRFVSYFGRYGVPAIPESLRDYNLSDL